VLLVTVDTLRADHTAAGEYELETTPNLRRLIDRGAVFTRCLSQHPETGPSLTSMMTSRHPRETGVRENGVSLPPEFPTLAESFRGAGCRTAAFVSTYLLKPHACGLDRGFGVYDAEMTAANLGHEDFERPARETVDRAIRWLREASGEPYFLWVHLYEPHGIYDPGKDLAARFFRDLDRPDLDPSRIVPYQRFGDSLDPDDYVARYDGEILLADREVGRLLDAAGEGAIVAFTADHGEGMGEQDYWFRHGSLLNEGSLRVPLVLAGPGLPSGRIVEELAANLDVAPTLLDLAGLPPLPDARGGSLQPLLWAPGRADRIVCSEARRRGGVGDRSGVDTRYKVSAARGARILVLWPETGESVLHRRQGDDDVAIDDPPEADALRAAAKRFLMLGDRLPGADVPGDVNDALRGLGYLRGGDPR
jgi:arylsulfatase A-like enzyme